MQYSVPQFIDVEDKIVGPLTGKQTLYLVIGGGILMVSYIFLKFIVFTFIFILVAPATLLLAFYKPKGTTVAQYIANYVDFITNSHLYVWRREPDMTMYKVVQKKQKASDDAVEFVSRSRIRDLANLLDTSSAVGSMYESDTRADENIFGR